LAVALVASLPALVVSVPASAEGLQPVLIDVGQADGSIFESPKAVLRDRTGTATKWVEMLKSADGSSAGIYAATASNTDIEAYPHDEFMYFLEGGVTLTSADGSVTQVKAGDGVVIPLGWKGNWTTSGYRKFYVTYGVPK
jgi:uncharacterized cupin superfamily protein